MSDISFGLGSSVTRVGPGAGVPKERIALERASISRSSGAGGGGGAATGAATGAAVDT